MYRKNIPPPSEETRRAQLALDLGEDRLPAEDVVSQPVSAPPIAAEQHELVALAGEVLPPAIADAAEQTPDLHAPTLGQLEHGYLERQAARYEDKCIGAVWRFYLFAGAALLGAAGVNALDRYGLSEIEDVRLFPAAMGAATTIFAFVTMYYALRARQHRPQLRLQFINRSPSGVAAQIIMYGSIVLVSMTWFIVLYATLGDMLYTVQYLYDHIVFVVEGWDPVSWHRG